MKILILLISLFCISCSTIKAKPIEQGYSKIGYLNIEGLEKCVFIENFKNDIYEITMICENSVFQVTHDYSK